MKALKILVVLALCFSFGFYVTNKNSKYSKVALTQEKSSRAPDAIKRVYDFSDLQGTALDQASKQRLMTGAKILNHANEIGVELGHFVVKGQGGQKTFACQKYSQIMLEFEGDGSAANGEKPKMEIEGTCEVSPTDINSTSPIWIPVNKILEEPVADGEFDFREGHPIKVRFSNVNQEWPLAWKLKSVKLFDQANSSTEFTIEEKELQQMSKPLIINFKN
jgi:hypothetical protein